METTIYVTDRTGQRAAGQETGLRSVSAPARRRTNTRTHTRAVCCYGGGNHRLFVTVDVR